MLLQIQQKLTETIYVSSDWFWLFSLLYCLRDLNQHYCFSFFAFLYWQNNFFHRLWHVDSFLIEYCLYTMTSLAKICSCLNKRAREVKTEIANCNYYRDVPACTFITTSTPYLSIKFTFWCEVSPSSHLEPSRDWAEFRIIYSLNIEISLADALSLLLAIFTM